MYYLKSCRNHANRPRTGNGTTEPRTKQMTIAGIWLPACGNSEVKIDILQLAVLAVCNLMERSKNYVIDGDENND